MFCTKCGCEINDEFGKCTNCEETEVVVEETAIEKPTNNKPKNVLSAFCFVVAAIVLVFAFIAAILVFVGGLNISLIESVGGRTLEEAYYHDLGKVYFGMSFMIDAIGIFFSSVFIYLGCKNIKK